jgi:hypothetical protein
LDALQVDDPVIHITQTAPGEFDFDDVLAHLAQRRKPDEEPSSPLRFALYNDALQGGPSISMTARWTKSTNCAS